MLRRRRRALLDGRLRGRLNDDRCVVARSVKECRLHRGLLLFAPKAGKRLNLGRRRRVCERWRRCHLRRSVPSGRRQVGRRRITAMARQLGVRPGRRSAGAALHHRFPKAEGMRQVAVGAATHVDRIVHRAAGCAVEEQARLRAACRAAFSLILIEILARRRVAHGDIEAVAHADTHCVIGRGGRRFQLLLIAAAGPAREWQRESRRGPRQSRLRQDNNGLRGSQAEQLLQNALRGGRSRHRQQAQRKPGQPCKAADRAACHNGWQRHGTNYRGEE